MSEITRFAEIKKIINLTVLYLKKYKVKNWEWDKIMKNDNIPQELKYFINGARYLYVKYMIHQINKINDKCLFVYPVGSTKLTSDKDIQISFNINCNENISFFIKIIKKTTDIIHKGLKEWHTKDLLHLIDTNFYPPSLINFISKKERSYNNKYIKTLKKNNKILSFFIPQFSTIESVREFYKCELTHIKNKGNENINLFYKCYAKEVAICFKKILNCYQNINNLTDIEFNNLLCCLIKYNNIGPEMYFSVSSVAIVVWHLQLKGKLSKKELEIMAPIAYEENKNMYIKTKKEKYKERYTYCLRYM